MSVLWPVVFKTWFYILHEWLSGERINTSICRRKDQHLNLQFPNGLILTYLKTSGIGIKMCKVTEEMDKYSFMQVFGRSRY